MAKKAPSGAIYSPPATASVLSFHGGGFLGYFSALVAEALKKRKTRLGDSSALANSFDLICGTSVGSIIAASVAAEVPTEEILALMRENGQAIFPERSFWRTKPGLVSARFSSGKLKEVLETKLRDKRMGDLDRALLIPAVNETKGRPEIFRSYDRSQEELKLVDVILASAAAPGYFPLHRIGSQRYADGGLVANGPELIAASDLASLFDVPVEAQRILSVGTTRGNSTSLVPLSHNDNWGLKRWVHEYERLQPLLMDGQVALQRELLNSLGPRNIVHLDAELSTEELKNVHLVLANELARQTLEKAAASCISNVSAAERAKVDALLSRVSRRASFFLHPGTHSFRIGLL
jgi:predicted acylesterase/phospholipase RssA